MPDADACRHRKEYPERKEAVEERQFLARRRRVGSAPATQAFMKNLDAKTMLNRHYIKITPAAGLTVAFAHYEALMREYIMRCQKIAEGADWFVPRTRMKLWLSNQMWRVLPYTPWKNMMIELPLKVASSISLKNCV
jgi:hypothetical protein